MRKKKRTMETGEMSSRRTLRRKRTTMRMKRITRRKRRR